MCKHLEVIIEVSIILFYSLTYLRLGVSEQDLGRFLGNGTDDRLLAGSPSSPLLAGQ